MRRGELADHWTALSLGYSQTCGDYVIWLDPRPRERDLLAAVVDR